MILVARNVVEAIAAEARRLEGTDPIRSARTLPGYEAWEHGIMAQYELPEADAQARYDANWHRVATSSPSVP